MTFRRIMCKMAVNRSVWSSLRKSVNEELVDSNLKIMRRIESLQSKLLKHFFHPNVSL